MKCRRASDEVEVGPLVPVPGSRSCSSSAHVTRTVFIVLHYSLHYIAHEGIEKHNTL